MFNSKKYNKTTQFQSITDIREWMRYDGHLWFFIDNRYYFMTGSRNYNQTGEVVPWWYITRGDYEDISLEEYEKILWNFYDLEEVWRTPLFNGKSFEMNFCEFVFYD